MDIVTRWVLHQYTTAYTSTSLVPTSYKSTVLAAYETVTFFYYSDDDLLSSCHSEMTYIVSSGALNSTHSLSRPRSSS